MSKRTQDRHSKRLATYATMATAVGGVSTADASLVIHQIDQTVHPIVWDGEGRPEGDVLFVDTDGGNATAVDVNKALRYDEKWGDDVEPGSSDSDLKLISLEDPDSFNEAFAEATAANPGGNVKTTVKDGEMAYRLDNSMSVGHEGQWSDDEYGGNDFAVLAFAEISNGQEEGGEFSPGDRGYIGYVFGSNEEYDGPLFGWADLTLNEDWSITLHAVGYNDKVGRPAHVGGGGGVVRAAKPLPALSPCSVAF